MRHKPEHMGEFLRWTNKGEQATYIPSSCSICDDNPPAQVIYDTGFKTQSFLCQECYNDFLMFRDSIQFIETRGGKK